MAEQHEIELLKSRILRLESELRSYKEYYARCNCVDERPTTPISPRIPAAQSPARRSSTFPQPEELVVIPYTASSVELSEPGESAYKRGTILVERTLEALRKSTNADAIARAELFFFLSSLGVLERLTVLPEADVQGLMQMLEGKVEAINHQRRVRDGALWFHEKIISGLCERGWTLHQAISVVAPRAPHRAYVYDDISHSKNIIPIIEALQLVKPKDMDDLGSLFFQYISYWQPSICETRIQQLLYPVASSLEVPSDSLAESSQSLQPTRTLLYSASNYVSHVASAQLHKESLIPLRSGTGYQQSKEIVPYIVSATSLISAMESPNARGYIANLGPQLQLSNQREVPDTAQSIWFAINGNIEGLKYLFSQGLASPKDVSQTRRYSLVRWALYGGMCNYATVKFLLKQGASVDEESYQHVWDYAFRKRCSSTELSELQCISMNPPTSYIHKDWVEEQQFPQIHNIVLGRCSELLSAEIGANPKAVHLKDAMNRTALDWATALAKLSAMKLLINSGSSLNTMDINGRTTVLHAVDSHNDDALRMVLVAGADPNPRLPKGLFRSSPLTAATFGGLVAMIKLLLEHGAEVDACNPEGRTALHTVASMQNVECAKILLDYGADMLCTSSNGRSPLTTAIVHNNHAVLTLFIDRCDTRRLEGLRLLPIVAEYANAETISILATSDLLKQIPDEDSFATSHESLQSRTDYDEALDRAFTDLCRQLPRGQQTTASTTGFRE